MTVTRRYRKMRTTSQHVYDSTAFRVATEALHCLARFAGRGKAMYTKDRNYRCRGALSNLARSRFAMHAHECMAESSEASWPPRVPR
jgi:hypothetical protein